MPAQENISSERPLSDFCCAAAAVAALSYRGNPHLGEKWEDGKMYTLLPRLELWGKVGKWGIPTLAYRPGFLGNVGNHYRMGETLRNSHVGVSVQNSGVEALLLSKELQRNYYGATKGLLRNY